MLTLLLHMVLALISRVNSKVNTRPEDGAFVPKLNDNVSLRLTRSVAYLNS